MPPPPPDRGRRVAVVAAVTATLLAVALAVAGFVVVPRLLETARGGSEPDSPAVGACYLAPFGYFTELNDDAERDTAVPCAEEHMLETIASGELSGASPPAELSTLQPLFEECDAAAEEYIGEPWRQTYAWLMLSVPGGPAWRDGDRWYRCDLALSPGADHSTLARVTGSLRDQIEPITCLDWLGEDSMFPPVSAAECEAPHRGELAGAVLLPELDWSDEAAVADEFYRRCSPIVQRFLGDYAAVPDELLVWYLYDGERDFLDSTVLCLVGTDSSARMIVGSLKDIDDGEITIV
jgi:hypothetical protein